MDYAPIFDAAGKQFNVDPALLQAQMRVESGGDPNARSPVGAQGLMQIMPDTARRLGVKDPTDPQQAIFGAAKLMAENLDRYGNVVDAVRAYHGGTDQSAWGPKTQAYVNKVMAGYQGAPMPGASPAVAQSQQDDLLNDFKAPSAQGATAPQDDLLNDFKAPAAVTTPAVAQGQQPAAPQEPGMLDKIGGVLSDLGTGAAEGLLRATDAPTAWWQRQMGKLGVMPQEMANEVPAWQASRRAEFEQANPGTAATIGRFGGEMAGTGALLGVGGGMLSAGGNALMTGLRGAGAVGEAIAPAASSVGNFLAGQGGILSRMTNMAGQGAAGAAILSGGDNPTPLSTQMELGALIGGAIPVVGGIARGLGAAGSAAYKGASALAGRGQENALNEMLTGAAQKGAPGLADLPAGAALDDIANAVSTSRGAGAAGENAISDLLGGKAAGAKVGADFTQYVPGAPPPTLAQATGNSGIAEMERAAISQNSAPFTAHEMATNAARANYLQTIRGTPETLAELQTAREAATAPLREAALANATGPADVQPVIDTIQGILKSPSGQQDAVVKAMNNVLGKLQPEKDVLQTDPAQLYGIRKNINNLLAKVSGRDDSISQLASKELLQVKSSLDDAITQAAPGFDQYIQTYANMSRPIDAQKFLQAKDLTDATGTQFSLNKMKNLMQGIQKLQSAPGANPAQSIGPEQMAGLQAIHMDLQRQANSMLGTGKNSATAQLLSGQANINNLLRGTVAHVSAPSIGAAVGGLAGGPLGAVAGSTIGHLAGNALERTAAQRSAEMSDKLVKILLGEGGADSLNFLVPQAQRGANALTGALRGAGGAAGAAGAQ